MAKVQYHEHPRQSGSCLPESFDGYVGLIPVDGYGDLSALWQAIRSRPFETDGGPGKACASNQRPARHRIGATACSPVQRSRVWPASMNCWEGCAHFVAGARRLLPDDWTIHVWDRDLPNGARHVWPSLMTPRGDHLLVDLNSTAERTPSTSMYSGIVLPDKSANGDGTAEEVGKDILGGIHVVGGGILKAFGLGEVAKLLEEVEGDALPDFARTEPAPRAKQKKRRPQEPRSRGPARFGRPKTLFGPGSIGSRAADEVSGRSENNRGALLRDSR